MDTINHLDGGVRVEERGGDVEMHSFTARLGRDL